MSPTTTMTPSGESPREARRPTALSSRKNTLIGTWNVRTMYESGRCENISNKNLWERTQQLAAPVEVRRRKWRWIGHTLRKDTTSIPRQALRWNPSGQRRVGRPRNTWRRSWEDEVKKAGLTWHSMARQAKDRSKWRNLASDLCNVWSEQA